MSNADDPVRRALRNAEEAAWDAYVVSPNRPTAALQILQDKYHNAVEARMAYDSEHPRPLIATVERHPSELPEPTQRPPK